jgi:hypothetical protein
LLLLLLLAGPAGKVLEARLDASAGDVRITYRFELYESSPVLGFSAFETSAIREISAFASGESLLVSEDRSAPPRLRGAIELPEAPPRELTLEIRYRAEGDRIPVVLLDLEPAEARTGAFTARVEGEYPGMEFPSNGVESEDDVFTWELPVIPAFLALGPALQSSRRDPGSFRRAGFSFWGLFAVNLAVVLLYVAWMRRAA